ncbi:MAG: YdcF family protein [Chitinophagaceae bacterium]|nr:YdcF family protein [Chitinophagaceae bacterium]
MFIASLILFLFFSNPYVIARLIISYQQPKTELQAGEVYSAGIVLGGFVAYDKQNNQAYFNMTSDRFIQTTRLYKKGHIKKIVVSAGSASITKTNFREADFVKTNLIELGIPEKDIITERNSRNTEENAAFSKRLLDSLQLTGPYLLITSAFHVPRASAVFKKAGMEIKSYPCAYLMIPSDAQFSWEKLLPSPYSFNQWSVYLKEIFGIAYMKLRGKI